MARSPAQTRTIAFSMVVLGFIAELVGIGMLSAEGRAPAALVVMVVGVVLVVAAVVMINTSRSA